MRRIFSLLTQVAVTLEDNASLQSQVDDTVRAAAQCQEDNQRLKRVSPGRRQGRGPSRRLPASIDAVFL